MDNEMKYDLKLILLAAREKKGYSQRKLARKIGIHHSSLNDLENGRIKKIDVEVLRKIAEELDLSLELLLNAAGYNQVANMFKIKDDPLNKKSTKDLKNLISKYRASQTDLLEDAYQKRDNVRNCRERISNLLVKLEKYDYYEPIFPMEKVVKELQEINKELIKSAEKYDYDKLPQED